MGDHNLIPIVRTEDPLLTGIEDMCKITTIPIASSRFQAIRQQMTSILEFEDSSSNSPSPTEPFEVSREQNQDSTGSQTEQHQQEQGSKLLFVKLTEHASPPTKGSKYSAGYDLKSAYDVMVPNRGSALVKTDIQIKLPQGTYGRVARRSGLVQLNNIAVGSYPFVDADNRGNLCVILFNHGDEDFQVVKGDRIAQLLCEKKIEYPDILEVENLDVTERGGQGFGSTGVEQNEVKMDAESETISVSPSKEVKVTTPVAVLSPSKKQPLATE